MVPPAAIALERLLARRRELGNLLLNADMYDRWGPKEGPEREQMMADAARAQTEHDEVSAALEALSRETWASEPEAVRAWAEAHLDLLERFIAANPGESSATARFVAGEELVGWREVAAGRRAFVDENVFYVSVDRDRFRDHFGQLR